MRYFTVKNFDKFQRYKDREPTWIMLHRTLLRDFEFSQLPDESKCHLMMIWLLLSQQKDRRLPVDPKWIASQIGTQKPVNLTLFLDTEWLELIPEPNSVCEHIDTD